MLAYIEVKSQEQISQAFHSKSIPLLLSPHEISYNCVRETSLEL